MIRLANQNDALEIFSLLLEFWRKSPFVDFIEPDAESIMATINFLINDEKGLLHVFEKESKIIGIIGFVLQPNWFNHNHITALELFWYVKPKQRGNGLKLFIRAKQELQRLGVDTVEMGAVPPYQKTETLYGKFGFIQTDRKYMGEITNGGQRIRRSHGRVDRQERIQQSG